MIVDTSLNGSNFWQNCRESDIAFPCLSSLRLLAGYRARMTSLSEQGTATHWNVEQHFLWFEGSVFWHLYKTYWYVPYNENQTIKCASWPACPKHLPNRIHCECHVRIQEEQVCAILEEQKLQVIVSVAIGFKRWPAFRSTTTSSDLSSTQ